MSRNVFGSTGYDLIEKRDIAKIQLDLTMDTFVELCGDDADWVDFLPYFGLQLADPWWGQWKTPLTIGDLCIDIASRVQVPVSEPIVIFGKICETAGMFSMMKKLLIEEGADTRGLAPSSPIAEYALQYPGLFCRTRLGRRGRLPEPRFYGLTHGLLLGLFVGILIGSLSYYTAPLLPLSILLGVVIGGSVGLLANGFINPHNRNSVRFPGIVTFRDFIHAAFDRPVTKPTSP